MTFGTWLATAFIAATTVAYWAVPARTRSRLLLLASYVFYSWSSPAHAVLLAALSVAVWAIARGFAGSPRPRRRLEAGIVLVLLVLFAFKYAAMAVQSIDALVAAAGMPTLPVPQIVAPLGISFIAFGLVHYLVEVYRGAPARTLLDFALYPVFFPTVVSGPIKRFPQFTSDLDSTDKRISAEDIAYGITRVLLGLAKKFVLADTLANLVGPLSRPTASAPFMVLVAVYAYAFRVYFDFAGYSDIAIGTARLFGFQIIENFRWPYLRRNLAEFWSNWHISLTRFITEYVFIPLGGSRAGRWKTARNTLVAMTLSGLWHGAAWHFVAWGLWHGVGLVVVRWWREALGRARRRFSWFDRMASSAAGHRAGYTIGVLVTFNYVALGWVLFAVPVTTALEVYSRLASFMAKALLTIVSRLG